MSGLQPKTQTQTPTGRTLMSGLHLRAVRRVHAHAMVRVCVCVCARAILSERGYCVEMTLGDDPAKCQRVCGCTVLAAAIAGARSSAQLLTNTAAHARRISSSPIVTLSPNGRASSYSSNQPPVTHHPPVTHAASSASAECADAFVHEPTEVPAAGDSEAVAEACAGSYKEHPDSVPDKMGQETVLQVGQDSSSSVASAAADKKEQTGNEKETWWECDYCSRAFTSLEVASTHELKCWRNPQVKLLREAEKQIEKAQFGELRRLLSPGHVCRSLLSYSRSLFL
jgi:hypothetical protein